MKQGGRSAAPGPGPPARPAAPRPALKTLYLLRHAKSSWADPGVEDHDRPLNRRGRAACAALAGYIARAGIGPDQVLCSTARRAKDTVAEIAAALGRHFPVSYRRRLYLAEPDEILAQIRRLDDGFGAVMIVGHSPGIDELAAMLIGGGEPKAMQRLHAKYPTGGLATIRFGTPHWRAIEPSAGRLEAFVTPKELGEE